MIKVKKYTEKGRGITATQNISKGTLIEVAPVAVFPLKKGLSINEKTVFKYYFVRPLLDDKSDNQKGYLVFGLASLCNHQESPNAYVDWVEDEIGLWSHLIAHKDIEVGEEVTLFYANIDDYTNVDNFV
ncbi:MAG: SET domain-containing protein-lysine N-methyltransferase [Cyanobacteria bacterium J06633_8]